MINYVTYTALGVVICLSLALDLSQPDTFRNKLLKIVIRHIINYL